MKNYNKQKSEHHEGLKILMDWLLENHILHQVEYRFHPVRRWRFDLALTEHKVAVEFEGGIFIQGRHSRGSGMLKDMEKYNTASTMGWRILRYQPITGKLLKTKLEKVGQIIEDLEKIIANIIYR